MDLDLSKIRQELDEIDKEIVKLYKQRMSTCELVAEYKMKTGKSILDTKREEEKINSVKALLDGEYDKIAIEQLYKQIMVASRRYQYQLLAEKIHFKEEVFKKLEELPKVKDKSAKLVYQGIKGAYSYQATLAYFGKDFTISNVDTFDTAVEKVANGEYDYAVLPMENSNSGHILDVYDLLVENDIYIVGEYLQKVNHALLGIKGARICDIKEVYSHPQALMQAHDYIKKNNFLEKACLNTAMAAKEIKDENDFSKAAIASELAADIYNLEILDKNIVGAANTTRFIILSKNAIYKENANKISLMFELKHTSGTLYSILANFIFNGINMLNIESRPIKNKEWEYRFFVDIEGRLSDANIINAIAGIKEEAINIKIFGNY